MDRMTDSGSVGWAFESPRDHKTERECERERELKTERECERERTLSICFLTLALTLAQFFSH